MWKVNLGINVEIYNTDWKVYLSRQDNLDYQISRAGWIGGLPRSKYFLEIMRPGRGNNQTGWVTMNMRDWLQRLIKLLIRKKKI